MKIAIFEPTRPESGAALTKFRQILPSPAAISTPDLPGRNQTGPSRHLSKDRMWPMADLWLARWERSWQCCVASNCPHLRDIMTGSPALPCIAGGTLAGRRLISRLVQLSLAFRSQCRRPEMRNRTLWLSLIFATSLAMQSPIRADENRGTLEQQLACTPDVFRLCSSEMPDANRIVACLRQNTAQLGDACRAVFEAKDSVPNNPVPNNPAPTKRASH
jgi:hypothetical protein